MSNNSAPKSGGSGEIVGGLIALAIFVVLCILLWKGITWAFNAYVDLLHVN